MRPEFSVILLTTLIGAGQGLFLALFAVQACALVGLLPVQADVGFYAAGGALAIAVTAAGLASSFSHLGHPERGWRAIARWRTSWLSREVIALPAFLAVLAAYSLAHGLGWNPPLAELADGRPLDATLAIGALGAAIAFTLFVCTGMVYACLPFLREWRSPLTVINFVLFGGASGFTLAAAFSSVAAPAVARFHVVSALVLTLLAMAGRVASLVRNRRLKPKSSLQTAIGVKHPRIVQKSMGFQSGSFNTREFFHGRSPGTLRWVRWAFPVAAFVVPAALLAAAAGDASPALLAPAFAIQFAGLVAERWFFFAEANHPQNIYYQAVA